MKARHLWAVATTAALTASLALAAPAYAHRPDHDDPGSRIAKEVKVKAVLKHLKELQRVSDRHGDRAAGRSGYQASVDYVVRELKKAGYRPEVQSFDFDYFEERNVLERVSPNPTSWVDESDFTRNSFDTGSPEGTATGPLVPVDIVVPAAGLPDNSNSSGCEPEDFVDFPADAIALVQRGTCGFAVKVLNAQAAGAAAVVVMNEGQPGRTGLVGMIGDATGLTIPAVFATSATGEDLASTPGATVTVTVDYDAEVRTSYNVFAETKPKRGGGSTVVMAGAHLDSVQDGAGINDNGTGSAALLETAIQLKKEKKASRNTVRFAWWGAEESGLLGSEHYVANLTPEQAAAIALYLNFDMIGSPNYFNGVYDGDNSSGTAPDGFIPAGSAEIEDVFEDFYADRRLPFQDTEFSGRSDYGPFIAIDIPAGGLFTGAEGVKTAEEAARYGGVAGAAYDPCYHAACDNYTGAGQDKALYKQLERRYKLQGNVNVHALDVNADAVATAVATFAKDASSVTDARMQARTFSVGAGIDLDALRDRFRE